MQQQQQQQQQCDLSVAAANRSHAHRPHHVVTHTTRQEGPAGTCVQPGTTILLVSASKASHIILPLIPANKRPCKCTCTAAAAAAAAPTVCASCNRQRCAQVTSCCHSHHQTGRPCKCIHTAAT
jgi:hypothetical protein